jgi:hypothetical protein
VAMKGKWAQGIKPRNFAWVIKQRFAVCERPGGYGANHRRVRRQEEIIWIREQGFTCVVSIIPGTHNLHNYTEYELTWRHRPFQPSEDPAGHFAELFPELRQLIADGGKILLHGEALDDRVSGLVAGYLVWSGMVPSPPQATMLVEQILERQIGPVGRELLAVASGLPADG